MMLQALSVISANPDAIKQELAEGMDDVMCRCGTHVRVMKAMELSAAKIKGGAG
jgi:isoquinoline 1-oxidoreductase alpha subunit